MGEVRREPRADESRRTNEPLYARPSHLDSRLPTPDSLHHCPAAPDSADPIGTANPVSAYLLVELPLPRPRLMLQTREDLRAIAALRMRRFQEGFRLGVAGIAPDPEWSVAGMRRVICLRRPTGPFARFERSEYLIPEDASLLPLAKALAHGDTAPPSLARYQTSNSAARDLLVCTHGSVDARCGRFGYPAYDELRHTPAPAGGPPLRVWRATHFGGHRFAPTMLDLPEGRSWAYLDQAALEQIVTRAGPVAALWRHYRGWAGMDSPFEQAAERAAFMREGWTWTSHRKAGRVLRLSEDERRADVRITYRSADGGVSGAYEATVAVADAPAGDDAEVQTDHGAKQYRVSRLWRIQSERLPVG